MPITREELPDDPDALREIILALHADLQRTRQAGAAVEKALQLAEGMEPSRLRAEVSNLAGLNAQLVAQVDLLQKERDALKHRLDVFLRNHFGRRSEKLAPGQQQLDFTAMADALIAAHATAGDLVHAVLQAAPEEEQLKPRPVRQAVLDERLPLEEKVHDLPENERACEKCSAGMLAIGSEESFQLEFVPATFKRIRHSRIKYACKACGECVRLAGRPGHAILKGLPGPGLLAQTLIAKYDDHQPLNRQQEIYARQHVHIARSTLCDWVRQSCQLLEPLADLMREQVLRGRSIHADETHVNFRLTEMGDACEDLEGDGDGEANPAGKARARLIGKGYMWVYLGDESHPYCCFDFRESRSRDGPLGFLNHAVSDAWPTDLRPGPWRGHLQCDAYKGYDELFRKKDDHGRPLVVEVACWAHARRYFFDAQNSQDRSLAQTALAAVGALYEIERRIKDARAARRRKSRRAPSYEAVARYRQNRAGPQLQKFGAWLDEHKGKVLPKSPMGQAIGYALDNWLALNRYTELGYLSIDNNAAERALRNVVLGRKNWLVAGSRRGGRWAAIAYTLIESAKRCGANVWEYMSDVIERIATTRLSCLEQLLPDQWLKAKTTASA